MTIMAEQSSINELNKKINEQEIILKKVELEVLKMEKIMKNFVKVANNHQQALLVVFDKLEIPYNDKELKVN